MVERIDGVNLRRQKRLQYSFDLLSFVLIKEQKWSLSQPKSGFLKRELGVQGTRQALQFALPTASAAGSALSETFTGHWQAIATCRAAAPPPLTAPRWPISLR